MTQLIFQEALTILAL